MKHIGVMIATAVVVALSTSVTAANLSKVQVATRLYNDCFISRLLSIELPTRRAPILNVVEEQDTWCYIWALVWYRSQFNEELEENQAVANLFDRNRVKIRSTVKNQILTEALQ